MRRFSIVYAILFTGLGVFLQLRFFPIGDIDLETDFYGDLVIAARNLVGGRFSVDDFPWKGPVYALLLAPARWVAGDWYRGAILLSALCGGLYLVCAYRLLVRVFDRRVALLSILAMPFVVEFFVYSHRAATDVPFMLLSLGSMSVSLFAGSSLRRHAFAGGLAALACLTRYNGVYLIAGTALMLAIANPDRLQRTRRAQAFAMYLAAFLVVCMPWFAATLQETGKLIATRNFEHVATTLEVDRAPDAMTLAVRYVRNVVNHFRSNLEVLLGWPLALVTSVGIAGLFFRPPNRRQVALYLFAIAYCLVTGVVFYSPRFYLPLILPLLALGFALVREDASGGPWLRRRLASRAAFACAAAILLVIGVVQARRLHAAERMIYARRPLYLLDAAQVLEREIAGSEATVLARKGHVAYYAGCDYAPYSTGVESLDELLRTAQEQDARYILYSKLEYSLLPRMLFMAVLDTIPRLQEIHRAESVRLFRVEERGAGLTPAERYGLLVANLRAARQQRRPRAVYLACEDLGRHHLEQGELAEAESLFQQALDFAMQSSDDPTMAGAVAAARQFLAATRDRRRLATGRD